MVCLGTAHPRELDGCQFVYSRWTPAARMIGCQRCQSARISVLICSGVRGIGSMNA